MQGLRLDRVNMRLIGVVLGRHQCMTGGGSGLTSNAHSDVRMCQRSEIARSDDCPPDFHPLLITAGDHDH